MDTSRGDKSQEWLGCDNILGNRCVQPHLLALVPRVRALRYAHGDTGVARPIRVRVPA